MKKTFSAGKLPQAFLERLLNRLPAGDPRVRIGPRVGEDAAVIDMGDRYLVAKTDPITFATDRIGWYLVNINANDVACMGADPKWLLVTCLLPEHNTDAAGVESLFDEVWTRLEGLDFLVNNASIFPAGRLEGMELTHLHDNLLVNAWAPFLLIRAFWTRLRGTRQRGSVVNLLDTRLVGGDLAHAPYHLSKSTLRELTTMAALEFSPELQVNGVAPGAVLPPEELGEDYLDLLTADLPLKRRGYPKDIADAIIYLLGTSFVTGQVIFVDGGRHIRLGGST